MFKRSPSTKAAGGKEEKGKSKEEAPSNKAAEQARAKKKAASTPSTNPPKKTSPKKKLDDITERTERYNVFVKRLDALILALQKCRECMIQNRKADQDLYRQVSAWTEGSPLAYSTSGSVPPSYKTVNSSISTASRCQEDQYEEKIIDYAIEWKKLVTLKFTSEYEEVQNSKRDVEHYTKKVTGLRGNRKRSKSNGKEVGTKLSEKLERNEEKLEQASKSYDKHKRSLLHLVDELVDKSWKDLFPLMILIFEFDVNNAQERAMVLSELHDVMKDLSVAASENGISLPPNGNSATELWRTLRSEWHGAPSTSMREGPTTPAKPRERRVLKTAFEDVDIDLGKTAPTPKQETLKDASLCEDAPKNSDSEDKPKKSGDLKDMPAIKTDKTASEATSDDVMYADATSFTEQMLDEELLESSWASDEAPVGF